MACYRTTSPTQQRDVAAAAAALADDTGLPLLVDLHAGLVIIDSGKDQWKTTPTASSSTSPTSPEASRPLPANSGPQRIRGSALRSAVPRRRRRRRSPRVLGRRTRIHPRRRAEVNDIHDPGG